MPDLERDRPLPWEADLLGEHWDALATGLPTPGDLDPSLAETIRRVRRFGAVPPPRPEFVARLREDLMDAFPATARPASRLWPAPPAEDRLRALPRGSGSGVGAARPSGFAWRLVHLAASVLLVAGLAAGYAALRFGRSGSVDAPPAEAPALVAAPTEDGASVELLMRAVSATMPPATTQMNLARVSYAPGAAGESTPGDGPELLYVESDGLALRPDGRVAFVSTGGAPDTPAAGSEVRLARGDRVIVPAGASYQLRNPTSGSANILDMLISSLSETCGPPPGLYTPLTYKTVSEPTPAPARIDVSRATLASGARLPAAAAAGLQLVAVEAGTLTADTIDPARPATAGATASYVKGQHVPVADITELRNVVPESLRNEDDKPLSLLLVTVTRPDPLT